MEPTTELESVVCPLCGSTEAHELFVARDRLLGRPGAFPAVRCARAGCGLVFLKPRPSPDALGAHYPDAYYPLTEEPSAEAYASARGLLARVTRLAAEHQVRQPRLLDIGCGTGLFLHLAQETGMRVQGIELSRSAVEYARARFGLNVYCGRLDDAELPDGAFDIVTMWHVLEHLPDPVAALRTIARALAPGGLLLVAVPNFGSFEARLFGRRWYSLDAPRHLVHFSPATLDAAFVAAGLRPVQTKHSTGTAGLVYSLMGDLTGISLKLRRQPLPDHTYHRIANALHVVTRPLCWAAARMERGGALEAVAARWRP